MKNENEFKGDWSETKAKLKQKFSVLTECDLFFVEGRQEELLSRLQIRLGKTKEEVQKIISLL